MDEHDYLAEDATGLAALIRAGEISAQEAVDAAIARIEAVNPSINAVVETLYESVPAQLAALNPDARYYGVPHLIKDLHTLVKGSLLTQGSAFLADHRSDHDSDLVRRLRHAGFVIVGRTNTPEFGLNATTEPRLHGATRNPWNLQCSPGGSSGGSAAAVASGMTPAAHATDSGGSTRIPAAACGLVGLKPSRGRNFAGLDMGEGWSDLFNAHAVTRSVRDSAGILDATCNRNGPAPYRAPESGDFAATCDMKPPRLRIGFMTRPLSGAEISPDCAAGLERTVALCQSLGHELAEVRLSVDGPRYASAFTLVLASSVAATVKARETEIVRPAQEHEFEPVVWRAIELARNASAGDLNRAIADIHLTGIAVQEQLSNVDLLLMPTTARPPLMLGELDTSKGDFGEFLKDVFRYAPFTALWNGVGLPAISLPVAWTSEGMPLGMQFVAHAGREDLLFMLAATLERESKWNSRQMGLMHRRF